MIYENIRVGMRVKLKHNRTGSGIKYTAVPVGSVGTVYKFIDGRNDAVLVAFIGDNGEYGQIIHVCDIVPDGKVVVL